MKRRALVVAIALAGAAALPGGARAAQGREVVDAGALRAVVQADPWHLEFVDANGREVLTEHPGRGGGPTGTVGFRSAGSWRHATRLLSERRDDSAWHGELATTDPERRIALTLARDAEGVIRLEAHVLGTAADVSALGIGFAGHRGERYLGFGERSNAVDQRGNTVETYAGEGAFQPEERPFVSAFVPPWGFRQRDDATYFPVPWLLSSAGYGVLVDNTETVYHRLGTDVPDAWSLEATSAPDVGGALPGPERIALRVFAGPRPADVLGRFTERTGRQPPPAAPWYFGPWYQPTGEPEKDILDRLQAADAPVSVAQTYVHYLPCGSHQGNRDEQRERTALYHGAGLAVTTYFNPMICLSYEPAYGEAASHGALTKNAAGEPYVYRYNQFVVSQFDFSSAAGRDQYLGLLGEAVDDGYDGWMEDFGEYTPLDSRSADGTTGVEMHNLYPVQYHCTAHEITRGAPRPLGRFIRSGYTGVAPCAQIVWNGDPTTGWGFDGLRSAIWNGLTMGLSGISTWGSDIGGFFALGTNQLTPELLKRWVQLGAVSGVMRTQAEGLAVPEKERPQIWDPSQLPHWRRWAKLRTQLYPYIVAADAEYRGTGMPIMRHLALVHPDDAEAVAHDDEFMFGPDLLAAPVFEPGARERRLYLPTGQWIDLWRSAAYSAADGGLELGSPRLLGGGRSLTLPAPLDELPLLARAGTLLALLPHDVDTLASYGDGEGAPAVSLTDRRDAMELLAFPRGESASRFNLDESLASSERRGRWELRIRGERTRQWRLQASLATLRKPFEPCAVYAGDAPLPASDWRYDAETGVLRATFSMGDGTLTVSQSCEPG